MICLIKNKINIFCEFLEKLWLLAIFYVMLYGVEGVLKITPPPCIAPVLENSPGGVFKETD